MMQIRLLVPQFHNVVPLDLEVYLQQVVPSEMPPDWPEQALLAQAIVCRSYAFYAMLHPRHSTEGADVCTGVHCQVFNVDRRHPATDHAVLVTQRQVLTYQGKVVDAVFSACCGGHTRDNEQVWKRGEPLAYLRGVECPCDGQKQRGHGVGMCQEGARALAAIGKSAEEILKHYYGDQVGITPIGEVIKADKGITKIGDAIMYCPACGWQGTVYECEPDIDGEGSLGCPKCGKIAQLKKVE